MLLASKSLMIPFSVQCLNLVKELALSDFVVRSATRESLTARAGVYFPKRSFMKMATSPKLSSLSV